MQQPPPLRPLPTATKGRCPVCNRVVTIGLRMARPPRLTRHESSAGVPCPGSRLTPARAQKLVQAQEGA